MGTNPLFPIMVWSAGRTHTKKALYFNIGFISSRGLRDPCKTPSCAYQEIIGSDVMMAGGVGKAGETVGGGCGWVFGGPTGLVLDGHVLYNPSAPLRNVSKQRSEL